MPRNSQFNATERQPFATSQAVRLQEDRVSGPIPFCNPTRAFFQPTVQGVDHGEVDAGYRPTTSTAIPAQTRAHHEWRSRENRKGRHVLVVPADEAPRLSDSLSKIGKTIWRMCTVYAWWDVSWWIAMLFSVGSAIFVICGFFYWLPLAAPGTEFKHESNIGGGVTAFVGATLFLVGGVLLIVEATNEDQVGCFGWALEQAFESKSETSDMDTEQSPDPKRAPGATTLRYVPQPSQCQHHHNVGLHHAHLQRPTCGRKWEWVPTWHELTTHYFHEIGFLGSFILSIGAIVFWFSGLLALPGIYDKISTPVLQGTYWLAYIVGGVLFVISSVLYVLETQRNWYTPGLYQIGWWIGVWNLIGSIGWTLSAGLGYCSAAWCVYQSDLTLIWASISFLIGSLLLWYEAMDKYPIEKERSKSV